MDVDRYSGEKSMKTICSIFLLACFFSGHAFADEHMAASLGGRTDSEFYLSLGVLVFGIIVLSLQVALMFKVNKGWGPNTVRINGLTLVIISGVFLITAGYSQEQIAPMIGLLGTIAGYLLGKSE